MAVVTALAALGSTLLSTSRTQSRCNDKLYNKSFAIPAVCQTSVENAVPGKRHTCAGIAPVGMNVSFDAALGSMAVLHMYMTSRHCVRCTAAHM